MAKKGKGSQRGMGRTLQKQGNTLAVLTQTQNDIADQLQKLTDASAVVQDNQGGAGSQAQLLALQIQKAQLDAQKDANLALKKLQEGQNKQISQIAKSNKDWKTFGDKWKDFKKGISDALDPDTIKKKLLGPFSMFKGVRNKMEDIDFAKKMKAQGDTRSKKELYAASAQRREGASDIARAQSKIDRLKAMGISDDEIKRNNPELYDAQKAGLKKYKAAGIVQKPGVGKFTGDQPSTPLPQTPSDKNAVAQSTTDLLADQQTKKENDLENLRLMGSQTDLLQQIATNTALMAGKKGSSAGGAEDTGGGGDQSKFGKVMSGMSSSMGKIGGAIAGVGQGIGAAIGGVFQGIMEGIANGIKAFANVKTLAGVAVLGLLTGVVWGLSKALENFQALDWSTLAKAGLALAGLIGAGALAGTFAPLLGLGALALGALGASLWVIGQGMEAMGSQLDSFIDGITRLSQIDYGALIGVAGGLTALSLAMAAFGAGQAAAGMGAFVGNLLTKLSGGKSPVEQIVDIGNAGDGVQKAADGISKLGDAMKAFSGIDKGALKPIQDFPWEKATAFVAAGGSMSVSGAKVENASKTNADTQAQVDGQKGAGTNVANTTQVNQNSSTTNVSKGSVRNTESSYNRYLQARY